MTPAMTPAMTPGWKPRLTLVAFFLAAVATLTVGIWRYGYVQALDGLAQQGAADLALSSDRVVSQLQRYRELAVLMAGHPTLRDLSRGAVAEPSSKVFQDVADKTAALEILFVDRNRRVLASAHNTPLQQVADVPFLRRAMNGALGIGHGTDIVLPVRAYYFAAPYFAPNGDVEGAVVVAADIAEIEWDWTGSNPPVFFTDKGGEVFITNRSELIYWTRLPDSAGLQPPDGLARLLEAGYVAGHEVWRIDWGPYLPERALHITRDLPVINLTAEALIDTRPALRLAGLQAAAVAGLCLAFGALLFLATERRRTLAEANAKLEARVATRTEALSQSNVALRHEVREREEAEAALRKVQEDLVQAGKLSALGQMSAGISHELNQPLMAIQNFAANATAFLDRGKPEKASENLGRIADLSDRIGRIIRNLRAFARQESASVTRVDLVKVLASAAELTEVKLRDGGVSLRLEPQDGPLWVQGGEVRLSQVFVNLISNAVDAMEGQEGGEIRVSVEEGGRLKVRVADTGPGIDVPDKVFEPFYSTKSQPDQEGMGLGLSISYGIVQSFGGDIRGRNAPEGGAVFTVELERWSEAEQVA